jgi:hypothetical protein
MQVFNIADLNSTQQDVDIFIRNSTTIGVGANLTNASGNGKVFKYEYQSTSANTTRNLTFYVEDGNRNASGNGSGNYSLLGMDLAENLSVLPLATVEIQVEERSLGKLQEARQRQKEQQEKQQAMMRA